MHKSMTFSHLITSGINLSFSIGIDFTVSNNPPEKTNSLHHIHSDPSNKNPYQKVITGIGSIIMNYNSSGMVPVFGFGAKVKFDGFDTDLVSHCFACNGDLRHSQTFNETGTFNGIYSAYYLALKNTEFHGPT